MRKKRKKLSSTVGSQEKEWEDVKNAIKNTRMSGTKCINSSSTPLFIPWDSRTENAADGILDVREELVQGLEEHEIIH